MIMMNHMPPMSTFSSTSTLRISADSDGTACRRIRTATLSLAIVADATRWPGCNVGGGNAGGMQ